ncbi:hypothetical protein BH24ACT5_BH24ACT5_29060 [soil metagenome]
MKGDPGCVPEHPTVHGNKHSGDEGMVDLLVGQAVVEERLSGEDPVGSYGSVGSE